MSRSSLVEKVIIEKTYFSSRASSRAERLPNSSRAEVLAFLEQQAVNPVFLAGMINDNGLESQLNRGNFYGCRNNFGELEGVALVGHATLIHTATDRALQMFAETAQQCRNAHFIMCPEEYIDKFWGYYAGSGQEIRRACRELLLELQWPIAVRNVCSNLRLATPSDRGLIMPVHAEMAFAESGVDPRENDADGFVKRCTHRIEQGRTWVLIENNELIFKADVIANTPEAAYLEGVWVRPDMRRQAHGHRCMYQLGRTLLQKSKAVWLFVNDENDEALKFYREAGYHLRGVYDTIFLK